MKVAKVLVRKYCHHCETYSEIELDEKRYLEWQNGELIQRVFPEMSADEREILISGTHPKCWNEMFGDENES